MLIVCFITESTPGKKVSTRSEWKGANKKEWVKTDETLSHGNTSKYSFNGFWCQWSSTSRLTPICGEVSDLPQYLRKHVVDHFYFAIWVFLAWFLLHAWRLSDPELVCWKRLEHSALGGHQTSILSRRHGSFPVVNHALQIRLESFIFHRIEKTYSPFQLLKE